MPSQAADEGGGTWSQEPVARMTKPRAGFAMCVVPGSGHVLAAGGEDETHFLNTVEIFDLEAKTWSEVAPMNFCRSNFAVCPLPDGRVLACGGSMEDDVVHSSAEIYDPDTNKWTLTGEMSTGRKGLALCLLPDGCVIVAGGEDGTTQDIETVEIFNPDAGSWTIEAGTMQNARSGHALCPLFPHEFDKDDDTGIDISLVAVGGEDQRNYMCKSEIYEMAEGSWNALPFDMHRHRSRFGMCTMSNGFILAAGGINENGVEETAELYDPESSKWSLTAPMHTARYGFGMCLLPDGRVLAAGGQDAEQYFSTLEVYTPPMSPASLSVKAATHFFPSVPKTSPNDGSDQRVATLENWVAAAEAAMASIEEAEQVFTEEVEYQKELMLEWEEAKRQSVLRRKELTYKERNAAAEAQHEGRLAAAEEEYRRRVAAEKARHQNKLMEDRKEFTLSVQRVNAVCELQGTSIVTSFEDQLASHAISKSMLEQNMEQHRNELQELRDFLEFRRNRSSKSAPPRTPGFTQPAAPPRKRPLEHFCPITHDVMTDPVLAADGHAYERSALQSWFQNHDTSPLTNTPIEKMMMPNIPLRKIIEEWTP